MLRNLRSFRVVVVVAIGIAFASTGAEAQRDLRVRIGTLVPAGSLWHETLQDMSQEWSRISNGAVRIQIFAGGVLGDELEMVRKVRQGQLQAVALSSVGLSRIDEGVACLQIPMLLESYA